MRHLTRLEQLRWLVDFLKEQKKILEEDIVQAEIALEREEELQKVKKKEVQK